jgi:DNA-binding response OmpR family regulator
MRLLIIEDDRRLNHTLSLSLSEEGYAVDCAFDGMEGQAFAGA